MPRLRAEEHNKRMPKLFGDLVSAAHTARRGILLPIFSSLENVFCLLIYELLRSARGGRKVINYLRRAASTLIIYLYK